MMKTREEPLKLLAVDTPENEAERWAKLVRYTGQAVRLQPVNTLHELEHALTNRWDLIISVEETPTIKAEQVLLSVQQNSPDIPVIISIGSNNPDRVTYWLERGAQDAIHNEHEEHLLYAIRREQSGHAAKRTITRLTTLLKQTETRCQQLLESSTHAIAYVHGGMHVEANPAYLQLFGYDNVQSLSATPFIDMVCEESRAQVRNALKNIASGKNVSLESPCHLKRNDGVLLVAQLMFTEVVFEHENCIQILVRMEESAVTTHHDSRPDENTILLPYKPFVTRLDAVNKSKTMICLQIDNYESIRKRLSIDGILSLQSTISRHLTQFLPNSSANHYSNDTYLINVAEDELVRLDELKSALQQEHTTFGQQLMKLSVTIGLVPEEKQLRKFRPTDPPQTETAPKTAEKPADNPSSQHYPNDFLDSEKLSRLIRQALESDSFDLLYQPVIQLNGEGMGHYEVLLQLLDESGSAVPEATFVLAAEKSGLLPFVDRWCLRQAIRQLSKRVRNGHDPSCLMVTLHSWCFQDKTFVSKLQSLLVAADIPGRLITLKLAESLIHQHPQEAVHFSERVKSIDCNIAVSDYSGRLFSSDFLQQIQPDVIFVSRQPVGLMPENPNELTSIVDTLKSTKADIVVPEINTAKLLTEICQLEVDLIQGHHLQPPMDAMTFNFNG